MRADAGLRANVRLLGDLLGRVLVEQEGQEVLDLVERIRSLSRRAAPPASAPSRLRARGPHPARVARGRVRPSRRPGLGEAELAQGAEGVRVELVFTAHPTEATRRTVLQAHQRIAAHLREPQIQQSVKLRNPYVDPMNAIQVELLRAHRAGAGAARLPHLRLIAGIAAALRNTG